MTIDDRAAKWSERRELYVLTTPTLMEASYHQGATDQRKIDINKACEWLENAGCVTANGIDCWEDFRKAMEE